MNIFIQLAVRKYQELSNWFVPSSLQESKIDVTVAKNTVSLAFIAGVSVPCFALLYHFLDFDKAGIVVLLGGVSMLCAPFILKITGRVFLAREYFICSFYALKLWLAFALGGMHAPTLPWFLLCPMIALILGGIWPGILWGLISIATVLGIFYLQQHGVVFPPAPVNNPNLLQLASVLGLFVIAAILLRFFETGKSLWFTQLKSSNN